MLAKSVRPSICKTVLNLLYFIGLSVQNVCTSIIFELIRYWLVSRKILSVFFS